MVSVSIPNIEITENIIQNCSIIIDGTTFNTKFSDGTYIVTKGSKSKKEADTTSASASETSETSESETSESETPKPESESESELKQKSKPKSGSNQKLAEKPGSITQSDMSNAATAFSKMEKISIK